MRGLVILLAACGSAAHPAAPHDDCERIHAHVAQLYLQGPPGAKDPALAREVAADNTHMVLRDCAVAPGRVAPCAERAQSIATLEHACLLPLDDEGTP